MTIQTDKIAPASNTGGNAGGAGAVVLPVAVWGFLQLGLLAIGACGYPLWAHHPLPRESLSLQVLICGQILLSSMLFPTLLASEWAILINMVLVLPMEELAGLLSHADQLTILTCSGIVMLWMLGLASCARLLKSYRDYPLLISLGMLLSAGGCVLDYLRWEASASGAAASHFAPLSLVCRVCVADLLNTPATWLSASLTLLAVWTAHFTSTLLHRKRKPSSTSSSAAK